MNQGCSNAYSGSRLTWTAATGQVNAVQNVDGGWTETVCYKCTNQNGFDFT